MQKRLERQRHTHVPLDKNWLYNDPTLNLYGTLKLLYFIKSKYFKKNLYKTKFHIGSRGKVNWPSIIIVERKHFNLTNINLIKCMLEAKVEQMCLIVKYSQHVMSASVNVVKHYILFHTPWFHILIIFLSNTKCYMRPSWHSDFISPIWWTMHGYEFCHSTYSVSSSREIREPCLSVLAISRTKI